MRGRLFLSLIAAVALLGATSASAGTLTSATWLQGLNTSGVVATVNVPIAAMGSSTGPTFSVTITNPTSVNLASTTVTSGSIPLGIIVSAGAGTAGLTGTPNGVNQSGGIGAPAVIKLGSVGGAALISLTPVAGSAGVNAFTVLNIPVTVSGFAWTAGAVTVTGLTNSPVVGTGTRTFAGSVSTSGGSITKLTLVSPSKITVGGAATSTTASFSQLTLNFASAVVPEPGTLLLLGAGLAGLGLLGRRHS